MPAFETGTASGASEASEQNGVFWRQIPETDLAVYNAAEREKIVQVYTNLMERNARRIMEYLASAPRDATLPDETPEVQAFGKLLAETEEEAREVALEHMRLEKTAERDSLTGLLRRDPFGVRYEIARASQGQPEFGTDGEMTVLFIDLDHFKHLNDAYGHGTVDRLLAAVGKKLNGSLSPSDAACRYGGDEIVVLLSHVKIGNSQEAVQRMYKALAGLAIAERKSEPGTYDIVSGDEAETAAQTHVVREHLSLSLGVRTIKQDDRELAYLDGVTRLADAAAYKTKHRGRGGITMIEGKDAAGSFTSSTYRFDRASGTFSLAGEKGEALEITRPTEVPDIQKEIEEKLRRVVDCVYLKWNKTLPGPIREAMEKLAEEIHGVCYRS